MTFKYPLFIFILFSIVSNSYASRLNDAIVQKTLTWNKLITEQNLDELEKMYTYSVMGYGVKSSTTKFMVAKAKFYKWAKGFTQTIISDFTIKKYKGGQIVCEFVKQSTFRGKTKNYPSYLVFEKENGEYLITAEGDIVADTYNGFMLNLGEVKSVDVVALNDIRTTNFTLPVIIAVVVILLLVFLVLHYRRNGIKSKESISVQQNQPNQQEKQPEVWSQVSPSKPDQETQKAKGDEFEKFIRRSFNSEYFETIHWTSDKGVDGIYARSNQNPDLVMQLNLKDVNFRFAVECKWRGKLPGNNEVELCRSDQLDRYKTYGKKNQMEVFIALGVGGKPEYPEQLYIVPLRYVSHPVVKVNFLEKYWKEPGSSFFFNTSNETLR